MDYKVILEYLDGKAAEITLPYEKIESFIKALKKGDIYWTDDDSDNGFWLSMDKIRYIALESVADNQMESNHVEENTTSCKELSEPDDSDSSGEEDVEQKRKGFFYSIFG